MNKAKRFIPSLIISLLVTAILAGCYFITFAKSSRVETEDKVDQFFSYIRETLDQRTQNMVKQTEARQNKMMGSLLCMSDTLWNQYGASLSSPKGGELKACLEDAVEASMVNLLLTDEQGTVLQCIANDEPMWQKLVNNNFFDFSNASEEERERIRKGTENEELNSRVRYQPLSLNIPSAFYNNSPLSYTVYSNPVGESHKLLILMERNSFSALNNYALQNASFYGSLDDEILFLEVDLKEKSINNNTPFDELFQTTISLYDESDYSFIDTRYISKIGISEEFLREGFKGELTIQGASYSCRTMVYQSELYPNGIAILALVPNVYQTINYGIWVVLIFLVVMVVFLFYSFFLKEDMIQETKHEDFKPFFGNRLFLHKALWKKLGSSAAITLAMVMLASTVTVTLGEISDGMRNIKSRQESMTLELSDGYLLQQISDTFSEMTYRQLAQTAVSFIEADPEKALHTENETIPFFLTNDAGLQVPYIDYSGKAVCCRLDCEGLRQLASKMEFSSISLYNVDGYPVSSSSTNLPERIGSDSPFFSVLTRQKNYLFSRYDNSTISSALTMQLFKLTDETGKERFLSKKEYEQLKMDDVPGITSCFYTLVMKEDNSAPAVQSGMEMAASLLEEDSISGNSYLLYSDNEQHTPLFIPSILNGLSPEAIAIPKEALEREFHGFVNLDGTNYQIYSRRLTVDDLATNDKSSYWLIALQESDKVFHYRGSILLYVGIVSLMFLLGLVLCQSICTKTKKQRILQESEQQIDKPQGLTAAKKIFRIIYVVFILFYLMLMLLFILYWRRTDRISVMQWISTGHWTYGFNVYSVSCVCLLLYSAYVLSGLFKKLIGLMVNVSSSRMETLIKLFTSILRYALVLFVIFYGLHLFGMNTSSVLTSLGLFSMLVGLGANKLIADIVAGIFIIMEGEFRVGDIVTIQNFCGKVTEIGVRTTKLENPDGNVGIYTNSSILNVLNMTNKQSRVKIDLQFKKDVPSEQVEMLLNQALPVISLNCPIIHENLEYKGIDQINGINNVYRIEANCNEFQRNALYRYLNKELIRVFKENRMPLA